MVSIAEDMMANGLAVSCGPEVRRGKGAVE